MIIKFCIIRRLDCVKNVDVGISGYRAIRIILIESLNAVFEFRYTYISEINLT